MRVTRGLMRQSDWVSSRNSEEMELNHMALSGTTRGEIELGRHPGKVVYKRASGWPWAAPGADQAGLPLVSHPVPSTPGFSPRRGIGPGELLFQLGVDDVTVHMD